MHSFEPVPETVIDAEYRAIEKALLETARGRWFLAEHSRRSRRIETTELEEALTSLKSSLREPPALLGRMRTELAVVERMLSDMRAELFARDLTPAVPGSDVRPTASLLEAAERLHELVWSLQAKDVDPETCEAIGRQAASIFTLTARQAQESHRVLRLAGALDSIAGRIAAVTQSIVHEVAPEEAEATQVASAGGRVA